MHPEDWLYMHPEDWLYIQLRNHGDIVCLTLYEAFTVTIASESCFCLLFCLSGSILGFWDVLGYNNIHEVTKSPLRDLWRLLHSKERGGCLNLVMVIPIACTLSDWPKRLA